MPLDKLFPLFLLTVLAILSGCSTPAQSDLSEAQFKECLNLYEGTWHATHDLCNATSDCPKTYREVIEPWLERVDPDEIDPTYQPFRDLLNINNYKCVSTELLPLLQDDQQVKCIQKEDCYPVKNYASSVWTDVLFCVDGMCKVTKYSKEDIQR